jgi:quinol monooxygenase YgiN
MSCTSIRYTVKEGRGDENQALIEQVFAELMAKAPDGLRYDAFRLEDGVTFVHVVSHESEAAREVLTTLPAFRAFQAGIAERCAVAPVRTPLTTIGSYGQPEPVVGRALQSARA